MFMYIYMCILDSNSYLWLLINMYKCFVFVYFEYISHGKIWIVKRLSLTFWFVKLYNIVNFLIDRDESWRNRPQSHVSYVSKRLPTLTDTWGVTTQAAWVRSFTADLVVINYTIIYDILWYSHWYLMVSWHVSIHWFISQWLGIMA